LVIESAQVDVPDGATEVTVPDIVLAEGLYLTGQLVDENKQPISGVFVAPFPASSPMQLQTGPDGNFGTMVRADKRPSGWMVGWNFPPEPGNDFSGDTTWAKVISKEPLVLQVSRQTEPEKFSQFSEIDMDAPVPIDRVVWGEIVDGWQPGFWLKSTGEPTNQQVPLNALVTYRVLLRNTSDTGRDVVFRKGPDVPYVIPGSQIVTALAAEERPQEVRSEVAMNAFKGESDYVIFIEAGESLLLYGSATSKEAGLFIGEGDSQEYSKLATVAQPGKNWIVQPLIVQTLTPEERKQLDESLKSDRSRSTWDMTMLDRNGQPRKETAKTATPNTDGIPATPFTRLQTLHAKIELDVGTLVAAVPEKPADGPKENPPYPVEDFTWGEVVDGLQSSVICRIDINAPGMVEFNEHLPCGVQVRNTTEKRIEFLVRMELPYLIPADRFQGELLPQYRAEPANPDTETPAAIYRMSLDPREIVFIPGNNPDQSPDSAISVGDALGVIPDSEDEYAVPQIATVHVGTNWFAQPLTIQTLTEAEAATIKAQPGEATTMKVDAQGKPGEATVTRVDAIPRGKTLLAMEQVEVATNSLLKEQRADGVTWGLIDKGLQCGIRLVNPQGSYQTGDIIEAELLYRNSSDEVLITTQPRSTDFWARVEDSAGQQLSIDDGPRIDLIPGYHDYQPGEVRSLGTIKVKLVAAGTPSPKDNREPGHITLPPGKYKFHGNGGVGGINPHSGKIEFQVAEPVAAPSSAKTIRGRIINEEKLGVPGAELLIVAGNSEQLRDARVIAQGTSDGLGNFSIAIPDEELGKSQWGQIWRRAPGYAAARGNTMQSLESLLEESLTYGPLVKTTGLHLVVHDPAGKPLVGARAEALSVRVSQGIGYALPAEWREDNSGVTDAVGRVHLPYIDPGSVYRLAITPEGHSVATEFGPNYFLNYRPQEAAPHFTFPTFETGVIEGQFVAAPGVTLPKGLTIPLRTLTGKVDVSGVRDVPVDDTGHFRIPDMPVGEISILKFLDDRQSLRPWITERTYVKTGETTKLEIPIVSGTSVTGRVQKSDTKSGVADYEFEVYYGPAIQFRGSELWLMKQPVKADAEGRYELFLPPGPINLRLTRYVDGYSDATSWLPRENQGTWGPLHEIPSQAEFELPTIDLVKMLPIQGQLMDQNDKPLAAYDWMVFGYPEIPGEREGFVMNSMAGVQTDKTGQFEGRYPETYPPVRWKVSHRVWKTKYDFDDIKYAAKVVTRDPLVLQVDTTTPLKE